MASVRVTQILSAVAAAPPASGDLAHRLVIACASALPVTGVGLVLMTDTGPAGTVAVTDGPAATMEELQFTLGEGPCLDAIGTGRPVLLADLARSGSGRWPGFSAEALKAGIRAIFAFPLQVGGIRVGVLDLYRDEIGVLPDAQLAEALSYADAATAVLLHLQAQVSAGDDGELTAIPVTEDRAEVHQATGMVAFQADVSLAQALVLLRARAFATERPILALARDVLSGALEFANDSDGQLRHS